MVDKPDPQAQRDLLDLLGLEDPAALLNLEDPGLLAYLVFLCRYDLAARVSLVDLLYHVGRVHPAALVVLVNLNAPGVQ